MSSTSNSPNGPNGVNEERSNLVYLAILSEQAERYDEMVEYVRNIASKYKDLTVEERNLLSVAYKNVVGARRASWRVIHSIESKALNENQPDIVTSYRLQLEEELRKCCNEILDLVNSNLIPVATGGEAKVFYFKMKGDYYRYLAEFLTGTERKEAADNALMTYKTASDIALIELPPTHPIRLGLALNFSVFYYEIMAAPERSCRLAKQAFDDAIAELDTLSEESYKDSTIIMQLLRDNLSLWAAQQMNDNGETNEMMEN